MIRKLCVAPMMGCTDRHCRFLFRLLSPNTLLYSEMLTTGALIHGDYQKFLEHAEDAASAIQLGGSDPNQLAQAARMVENAGYQEVNINCGFPSDRVQQGGIGACLMAAPRLVAQCYEAMADAGSIPVTTMMTMLFLRYLSAKVTTRVAEISRFMRARQSCRD